MDILLFALGKSAEFAGAWRDVWRTDEYLAKVDAALASADVRPNNQWPRFACLRMATVVCESGGQFERSQGYIQQMYRLAQEPAGGEETPEAWLARAIGHDIQLCRCRKDDEGASQKIDELAQMLASAGDAGWARGQRHDLGCKYIWNNQYEKALLLFERNAASGGQVNGWGYVMHAVALWKMTGDRARTLEILREAPARENRDMTDMFLSQSGFADVKEDAEFLSAVRVPG